MSWHIWFFPIDLVFFILSIVFCFGCRYKIDRPINSDGPDKIGDRTMETEFELATIKEVLAAVKKAKSVMVWSNWSEHDGDYFKVEKGYFLKVMAQYKHNNGIKPQYIRICGNTVWVA